MAQRSSHRRTLANPDVNPKKPTIIITTTACNSSNPTTQTLDPTVPSNHNKLFSMFNKFSRSNFYPQKIQTLEKPINQSQQRDNPPHPHPSPPPPPPPPPPATTKDIRLQAKALTLSADLDSIVKPSHTSHQSTNPLKVKARAKELSEKGCIEKKELSLRTKDPPEDGSRVSVSLLSRRRSFYGSKVELSDVLANCGVKIVSVDMPPFMQIHAVDCARKTFDSLEKFTSKTLALTLKKEFDGSYGPAWHCIVGTSFGSFVTHSVGGFLYFSMDSKLYVLLFKTTVQKAD